MCDVRFRFKEFYYAPLCVLRSNHVLNGLLVSIATRSVILDMYPLRRHKILWFEVIFLSSLHFFLNLSHDKWERNNIFSSDIQLLRANLARTEKGILCLRMKFCFNKSAIIDKYKHIHKKKTRPIWNDHWELIFFLKL